MPIGFLGGTGIEGKGLALRFASAGAEVILGSRSAPKAVDKAREYNSILGRDAIRGMANEPMLAACDIVFLTVPFESATPAIESCGGALSEGTILVDVTVPTVFSQGRVEYLEQPSGSNSETIAARLPEGVALVGAFKTIPAHLLADLAHPLDCDLFVCADDGVAKARVMELVRLIPTLRPLDAGPLSAARTLERMTILAIHLNRRYKSKHARFRIIGI